MKECSSDSIAASMRRLLILLGAAGSLQPVEPTVERSTGCQTRTKLSAIRPRRASEPVALVTSPLTTMSLAAAIVRSFVYVPLTHASPHEDDTPDAAFHAPVAWRYGFSGLYGAHVPVPFFT